MLRNLRLSTRLIFSYVLVVLIAVVVVGAFALPLLQNSENARTQADTDKLRNETANRLNIVNLLLKADRPTNPFVAYRPTETKSTIISNAKTVTVSTYTYPPKPTTDYVEESFDGLAATYNLRLLVVGAQPNEVWLDTEPDKKKQLIGLRVDATHATEAVATARAGNKPASPDLMIGGNGYFAEQFISPRDNLSYEITYTRMNGVNMPNIFGLDQRQKDQRPQEFWLVAIFPTPLPSNVGGELLRILLLAGAAALLVSFLVSILLARSLTRPLVKVTAASQALAKGDYSYKVPLKGSYEMVKLAESFNSMSDDIADSQRLQRELIANVSHELKTPLTAIKGFSQAMVDGVLKRPEDFAYPAELIHTETERMIRLVNSLLDLSKLESGQTQIAKEELDLSSILERSIMSFHNRADLAEVRLVRDFSPTLPLLGDPDRLRQVFNNLIDNALRYTPTGGTITVSGYHNGQNIMVKVSDSGTGIATEDLPHVFERFFQSDKSRSKSSGGLGLGLAICKEIINVHGGKIEVSSEVGKGTTFIITLPALPHPSPRPAAPAQSEPTREYSTKS